MEIKLLRAERRPDLLTPLFAAYADMLYHVDDGMRECLANQNYDEELSHLQEKYTPPFGSIYAVQVDDAIAGMGAILHLEGNCGELKRIFLYPQYRGHGISLVLMEQLLADAAAYGYRHIRLDTFPAMVPACGLYEKLGFYRIPKYNTNPLLQALYYQKDL